MPVIWKVLVALFLTLPPAAYLLGDLVGPPATAPLPTMSAHRADVPAGSRQAPTGPFVVNAPSTPSVSGTAAGVRARPPAGAPAPPPTAPRAAAWTPGPQSLATPAPSAPVPSQDTPSLPTPQPATGTPDTGPSGPPSPQPDPGSSSPGTPGAGSPSATPSGSDTPEPGSAVGPSPSAS